MNQHQMIALISNPLVVVGAQAVCPEDGNSAISQLSRIPILDTYIAGTQYYEGIDHITSICIDDYVELVHQSLNKHDPYAIAIYWKTIHLGFIPKPHNIDIAKLLMVDLSVYGSITRVQKSDKNAFAIRVVLEK